MPSSVRLTSVSLVAEPHVPAPAGLLGEHPGHVVVLGGEQRVLGLHLHDLGAERREHVGELAADVPAAEDAEPAGELVDPHHVVARVGVDVGQAGDVGHHRPAAGGDHDLVGRDVGRAAVVQVDPEALRAGEAGGAHQRVDERQAVAVLAAGVGDGVESPEDPVTQLRPGDAVEAGAQLQPVTVRRVVGHVGRQHEHLGRDAPAVEARAAVAVPLDDGHAAIREAVVDDRVARAGAEDDEVVVRHAPDGRG